MFQNRRMVLATVLVIVWLFGPLAQADPTLGLGVGATTKDGEFKIRLLPPGEEKGQDFAVKLPKATGKGQKAGAIADEVNTPGPPPKYPGWKAFLEGSTVRFEYKGKPVTTIIEKSDGTGEGDKASWGPIDKGQRVSMMFGLDGPSLASGLDGFGNPSFVLFGTNLGEIKVPLAPGFGAEDAVRAIYNGASGWGLEALRWTSPRSFAFELGGTDPFMATQSTDLAWSDISAGAIVPEPCSLALFALGGLPLLRRFRH